MKFLKSKQNNLNNKKPESQESQGSRHELSNRFLEIESLLLKSAAPQPNIVEKQAKVIKDFQSAQLLSGLKNRFPDTQFIIENQVPLTSHRISKNLSNYYEIFEIYAKNFITRLYRHGIEKKLTINIVCCFKRGVLHFSLLVDGLRFAQEDKLKVELNRTQVATKHLLTPFEGKIETYLKKTPSRNVHSILLKMQMTPQRQHLPKSLETL